MLNQQIGPYRINNLLGEGGMAQVYLAEKGNLGKNVALKVLKREFLYNNHIRGRFLAEAKNMIQLNHPNIVGVQDLIDESDFVAIELEYIEGETLKQYLERKGALPDAEIERLIEQMWSAVSYIHQKGFVHRDIKPSNFMLTSSGVIKLTDFGIAKNMDGLNSDYTGTGTGMVLGTPKYMSPEQVRNTRDVNAQSDIYSLGVVLWEMVTGRVPYDVNTESTFDVFTKIVNEPLSKTGTRWDGTIEWATRKKCEERILKLTFEQAKPIEEPKTTQEESKQNKMFAILVAIGLTLILIFGGV
jgi:serine/threonine-protein kinase